MGRGTFAKGMNTKPISRCHHHGWLDTLAISVSVVCAVHCLVTPVLIIALPVLAATFWVDENFHLWMIGLVLPTSAVAVFLGCRRHKDRAVLALSVMGLVLLTAIAVYESAAHAGGVWTWAGVAGGAEASGGVGGESVVGEATEAGGTGGCVRCASCATDSVDQASEVVRAGGASPAVQGASRLTAATMVNLLGGMLLASAHVRNYLLCRRQQCTHKD